MQVAKLLRDHCLPDWQWTHFPAGELRAPRVAKKLKQMGLAPGWPDFLFISPHGSIRCLELKRHGGVMTDSQKLFRLWCIKHGVPYVIARTLDQALFALGEWGCLRIEWAMP